MRVLRTMQTVSASRTGDRTEVAGRGSGKGRRWVTTGVLLAVALLAGGALSGTGSQVRAASSMPTITVLTGPSRSEYDVVETIAGRWNATHDQFRVKVEMIPEGSVAEQIFLVRLAGGTPPDLYTAMAAGPMVGFSRDGALLALDQFKDYWTVLQQRSSDNIARTYRMRDGHYYLVPWQAEVTMIEYNRDLLDEIGWGTFPGTYSQFFDLSEKLVPRKIASIDVWMNEAWDARIGDFYAFYLAASGGRTLIRNGRAAFDNDYARAVFQFFTTAVQRKFTPQTPITGDGFLQGKILTQRFGQGALPQYTQAKFHWQVSPILVPDDYKGPDPPYTYFNMKGLSIPKSATHPQQAWEFLKYMIQEEGDLVLLQTGRFPVREDLVGNKTFTNWFRQNPLAIPFAMNMAHTRGLDLIPNTQDVFRAISEEFVASVTGKKSVSSALQSAVERVDKLLF